MNLTLEDVEKIARLAQLTLSDAQKEQYRHQLSAILAYADRLAELPLAEVSPTSSALLPPTVWREDEIAPSLTLADLMLNAPEMQAEQFLIHAVLDEES